MKKFFLSKGVFYTLLMILVALICSCATPRAFESKAGRGCAGAARTGERFDDRPMKH